VTPADVGTDDRARAATAATLALLDAWHPPSVPQARLREQFVDHLRAHPDGLLRTCRPDHLTASVLVVSTDADRVLLTLHAKAGAWFQLGGHVEPADADVVAAATREAREESGLLDLVLDPVPVHLDVHPVPFCGDGARHLDVRFVAVAADEHAHRISEESSELRWWAVDALPGSDLTGLVVAARTRVLGG
jgi:8-oxo-dGTP pyrophosphatase MutT (NUDIX family)